MLLDNGSPKLMNMSINYLHQMLKECLISWAVGCKHPLILYSFEMKLTLLRLLNHYFNKQPPLTNDLISNVLLC